MKNKTTFKQVQKEIKRIIDTEGGRVTYADGRSISVYTRHKQYGWETPYFCVTNKKWNKMEQDGWGITGIYSCSFCGMIYNQNSYTKNHKCNIFREILHKITQVFGL